LYWWDVAAGKEEDEEQYAQLDEKTKAWHLQNEKSDEPVKGLHLDHYIKKKTESEKPGSNTDAASNTNSNTNSNTTSRAIVNTNMSGDGKADSHGLIATHSTVSAGSKSDGAAEMVENLKGAVAGETEEEEKLKEEKLKEEKGKKLKEEKQEQLALAEAEKQLEKSRKRAETVGAQIMNGNFGLLRDGEAIDNMIRSSLVGSNNKPTPYFDSTLNTMMMKTRPYKDENGKRWEYPDKEEKKLNWYTITVLH
jgi:hypothetical protein